MKPIVCFIFMLLCGFAINDAAVDRNEARRAFELINLIRSNPEKYGKEINVDLSIIKASSTLAWNNLLARAAEEKALDMAKRNYISHINPDGYGMNYYINKAGYQLNAEWLLNKKNNYFESIHVGNDEASGAVKSLIIDSAVTSLAHRFHLLGYGEWNESLQDIGVGFVRCSVANKYQTYMCVLIAKHSW